ncbi:MAG: class I SAM-dependent methyltransferase [Gemmataceae bacterium]
MGLYRRILFPRLCDLTLDRPHVARRRRALLAEAQGEVLEIGFGTGLNLPCYPDTVRRLTTVEPNPGMHALAQRRLRRSPISVEMRVLEGEQLPFDANSFDYAVSTFTLCSVAAVERVLAELYRVLRPGGRLLLLEHGLSPDPAVSRWQRRLNWLQMWLGDGCRLDHDLRSLLTRQPYSALHLEQFYLEHTPPTHGYLTQGVATK